MPGALTWDPDRNGGAQTTFRGAQNVGAADGLPLVDQSATPASQAVAANALCITATGSVVRASADRLTWAPVSGDGPAVLVSTSRTVSAGDTGRVLELGPDVEYTITTGSELPGKLTLVAPAGASAQIVFADGATLDGSAGAAQISSGQTIDLFLRSGGGATYASNAALILSPLWTTAELFDAGEYGIYIDPSNLGTLWQDAAGTIPVTTVGQTVARINDAAGSARYLLSDGSSAIVLGEDSRGRHLLFAGAQRLLFNGAFTPASPTLEFWIAIEPSRSAVVDPASTLLALGASGNGHVLLQNPSGTSNCWLRAQGTTSRTMSSVSLVAAHGKPLPAVLRAVVNVAAPVLALEHNGQSVEAPITDSLGSGNLGGLPLSIGASNAKTAYWAGKIYGLIGRSAITSGDNYTQATRKLSFAAIGDTPSAYKAISFAPTSRVFDTSPQTVSDVRDVNVWPDGSGFIILSRSQNAIYQYALSAPSDVSTATYVATFSLAAGPGTTAQGAEAHGLYTRSDGRRVYVMNRSEVWQYTLSIPFDITTAVQTGYVDLGFSNIVNARGHDIDFRPDGMVFFVDERFLEQKIIAYQCATAWQVTGATRAAELDISGRHNAMRGTKFAPNGRSLTLLDVGLKELQHWSLSVPWDLATAELKCSGSLHRNHGNPRTHAWLPGGQAFLVGDATTGVLREYTVFG